MLGNWSLRHNWSGVLFGEAVLALNTSLYATEFKGNNSRFLYYLLKTLLWESYATASAVPGINRNHVNAIPVCLPDLECQIGIVSMLGALDDKITLNNRLNGYLAA